MSLTYTYNDDGTFTLNSAFSSEWNGLRADIPRGVITNFPSFSVARALFNPLLYVREATLHDALVGEYGNPVKITVIKTGEVREATWKESAKWFKHELNKNHNRLISQLFYGFIMAWKRFR